MKQVLLIGGGSGLGRECVDLFLENGWSIYVVSRTIHDLPTEVKPFSMPSSEKGVEALAQSWGPVEFDSVICFSGGGLGKKHLFEPWQSIQELLWLNLGVPYVFLKYLCESHNVHLSKFIVFGSIAAREAIADNKGYSVSKAALESMVRFYGRELVKTGISLMGVSLGATIATGNAMDRLRKSNVEVFDRFVTERLPRMKMSSSGEVFALLEFLSSGDKTALAGSIINLDGGESISR